MGTGVQVYDWKSLRSVSSSRSLCKDDHTTKKSNGQRVLYRPVSSVVRYQKKMDSEEVVEGIRELHKFVEQ